MTESSSYGPKAIGRSQKEGVPEGAQITTRQVYAALSGDDGARSAVLARFRSLGGDLDRWQRRDREAMAEALTRTEDEIELASRGRLTATRTALRTVRRRLEWELWP